VLVLGAVLVSCGPTAEVITTLPPGAPLTSRPATGAPPSEQTPETTPQQPSSSGEPVPPASDAPPSSLPPAGNVWQPLTDFPVSDAFEVTAVTTTPAGFVAVGFRAMPGEGPVGRSQGLVWRSADGRTWQPQVDPAFEFVTLEAVAALGDSAFAFGSLETCDLASNECEEPSEAGWGMWRSIAGGPWERLAVPESMQIGTMDGVTVVHGALVASGWAFGETAGAIIWRSSDGVTWTESTNLAGMAAVTATGEIPGGFVVFGDRFSPELGDVELLGATTTDGVQFAPLALPALPAATIESVAAGSGGVIAVGDADDPDVGFNGVVLHSSDGLTWTQGAAGDGSFSGATIRAGHPLPNGYVAIGYTPDEVDASSTGASWITADGLAWRRLAPLGGSFTRLLASAVGAGGVVAFTGTDVGFDDEFGAGEIDAWFAPIEALQP
jgi:hypothetical protein